MEPTQTTPRGVLDLVQHCLVTPAKADHGGMRTVAIAGLLDRACINVQWPQDFGHFHAQLPEWPGDVLWLGDPVLAVLAHFAEFWGHRAWGHPTCVHGPQGARTHSLATLAHLPGAILAPQLCVCGPLRRAGRRHAAVVGGDVCRFWLGKVVVHKERLSHTVPVCFPPLLVGSHLGASQVGEGALALGQHAIPLFCSQLAAIHGGGRSRLGRLLALQGRCTAILRFESTNIPVQPGERAPVVLLPPATVLSKARLIGYALKIQSAGLNNDLAHVQQVLRATKQIDTLRGPQSQASHI